MVIEISSGVEKASISSSLLVGFDLNRRIHFEESFGTVSSLTGLAMVGSVLSALAMQCIYRRGLHRFLFSQQVLENLVGHYDLVQRWLNRTSNCLSMLSTQVKT